MGLTNLLGCLEGEQINDYVLVQRMEADFFKMAVVNGRVNGAETVRGIN